MTGAAVQATHHSGKANMNISGSVALVTGANRGIGRHFATQLLERGAAKVYATARHPERVNIPGAHILPLDITDTASINTAATETADVTLLVNNAGILTGANLVTGDLSQIRLEMDTHFFGTLAVVRAYAPILAANGGGAIVNVLSALSWFSYIGSNAYAAAKAAEWSMTNGIRLELAEQRTLVTGVHLGAADTDIMAGYKGDMVDPADVARAALNGVSSNAMEVLVDDWSQKIKATLSNDPSHFYTQVPAN